MSLANLLVADVLDLKVPNIWTPLQITGVVAAGINHRLHRPSRLTCSQSVTIKKYSSTDTEQLKNKKCGARAR